MSYASRNSVPYSVWRFGCLCWKVPWTHALLFTAPSQLSRKWLYSSLSLGWKRNLSDHDLDVGTKAGKVMSFLSMVEEERQASVFSLPTLMPCPLLLSRGWQCGDKISQILAYNFIEPCNKIHFLVRARLILFFRRQLGGPRSRCKQRLFLALLYVS